MTAIQATFVPLRRTQTNRNGGKRPRVRSGSGESCPERERTPETNKLNKGEQELEDFQEGLFKKAFSRRPFQEDFQEDSSTIARLAAVVTCVPSLAGPVLHLLARKLSTTKKETKRKQASKEGREEVSEGVAKKASSRKEKEQSSTGKQKEGEEGKEGKGRTTRKESVLVGFAHLPAGSKDGFPQLRNLKHRAQVGTQ